MSEPKQLGKYEIIEEIGRGSYGVVYKAHDTTLDREVALKVLHPQLLVDQAFVMRFQREARILAQLRHSHIVTVYEAAEVGGNLYLAMDLARGPSLATAIAQRGRIPWEEALALLEPVCEALDYAHRRGIVHRDLKPLNILLDEERGPLLVDFGIARLVEGSSVSLTTSGVLGTLAYIAPEVWNGDVAKAPADIYALGCIAYEMVTGDVLFPSVSAAQSVRAHFSGPRFPTQWPKGVPGGVESILSKALAYKPGDRFVSAGEMMEALKQVVSEPVVEEAKIEWPVAVEQTPPVEDRLVRERQQRGRRARGQKKALPTILFPTHPFESDMILIPAGEFLMGSDPRKDPDARKREQPQHTRHLPDYYLSRIPVTNEQYCAFTDATGHLCPSHWGGTRPSRDKTNHPVVNIAWADAIEYCNWLAEATGEAYCLPSEEEWEKGARGTGGLIYPWGDQWNAELCNCLERGDKDTTPVGTYPAGASPYGLWDMAGNVWEWTRSVFRYYPYSPTDGREDPGAEGNRVLRGGGFLSEFVNVRSAYRLQSPPEGRLCGFRVCVVAQQE